MLPASLTHDRARRAAPRRQRTHPPALVSNQARLRDAGLTRSSPAAPGTGPGGGPLHEWVNRGLAEPLVLPDAPLGTDRASPPLRTPAEMAGHGPAVHPAPPTVGPEPEPAARPPGPLPSLTRAEIPLQGHFDAVANLIDALHDTRLRGIEEAAAVAAEAPAVSASQVLVERAVSLALDVASKRLGKLAVGQAEGTAKDVLETLWSILSEEGKERALAAIGQTPAPSALQRAAFFIELKRAVDHLRSVAQHHWHQGLRQRLVDDPQSDPWTNLNGAFQGLAAAVNQATQLQAFAAKSAWITHLAQRHLGADDGHGTRMYGAKWDHLPPSHTPGVLHLWLRFDDATQAPPTRATIRSARMAGVGPALLQMVAEHPLDEMPIPIRFVGSVSTWPDYPYSPGQKHHRFDLGRNERGRIWYRSGGSARLVIAVTMGRLVDRRFESSREVQREGNAVLATWLYGLGIMDKRVADFGLKVRP